MQQDEQKSGRSFSDRIDLNSVNRKCAFEHYWKN
jgi:hypothetical protein